MEKQEYFVRLRDTMGGTGRIAVGNFMATCPSDAVARAEKKYPGLFKSMETRSWQTEVELCAQRPRR